MFKLHWKAIQTYNKIHTPKIEDFKDWLKCIGGSNKILSDHQLMFKANFDVMSIFIVIFF